MALSTLLHTSINTHFHSLYMPVSTFIILFFNIFASPYSPAIPFKASSPFMLTWPHLSPVLCISLYFKLALRTPHSLTYQMLLCGYPLLLMTPPYCLHLACLDRQKLYFRMVVLVLTLFHRSTACPKSLKLPSFTSFLFPSEIYVTYSICIILSLYNSTSHFHLVGQCHPSPLCLPTLAVPALP